MGRHANMGTWWIGMRATVTTRRGHASAQFGGGTARATCLSGTVEATGTTKSGTVDVDSLRRLTNTLLIANNE